MRLMAGSDRESFAERIGPLRRLLVGVGMAWVSRLSDLDESVQLRREVLLWDVELGQRALYERYLNTESVAIEASDADPPILDWPFLENWGSESGSGPEGYLSIPLTEVSTKPSRAAGQATRKMGVIPPENDCALRFVEQGLGESDLAEALESGTVLLRLGIDKNEHVFWDARRSDGHQLTLVAHGPDRLSNDASGDLETAAAWHDFRLRLLWAKATLPRKYKNRGLQNSLGPLKDALSALAGDKAPCRLDGSDAVEDSLKTLIEKLCEVGADEAGKHWLRSFRCDVVFVGLTTSEEMARRALAPVFLGHLRSLDDWLRRLEKANSEESLSQLRDESTRDFIEAASAACDLNALAPHLGEGTDLVVQLDPGLQAIPVAYLTIDGLPLHRRASSVCSSWSLLLTTMQRRFEAEGREVAVAESGPDGLGGRMLAVSWFQPGDPARAGAIQLHRSLERVAEDHGLELSRAAERPPGSLGTLAQGLVLLGPFRVAVVHGHGCTTSSGVVLGHPGGQSSWCGGGCDLSRVELLVLLSCSIGRGRKSLVRDVEGFGVELALHRARSVLSCRWEIHALEARNSPAGLSTAT